MRDILVNRIRTPDGTTLVSRDRHDYKTYTDENGCKYMVDGGMSYLRRNLCTVPHTETTIYSDNPHEDKRNAFMWGTYGKDGRQAFSLVLLKDMTASHIEAVLETQFHIPKQVREMFEDELKFRGEG